MSEKKSKEEKGRGNALAGIAIIGGILAFILGEEE